MPPGSLNSRWGGNPTDCSTTLPYEALRVRFYPRENPPFDATIRASQSPGESNDKKYPEVRVSDVGYPGLSGCTVLCDGHFFGNYAARETSRKGTLERVSKIASAVKYQGGGMMLEKDSCSVRLDLTAASRGEIRVEGASATQRSTAYSTEYSPRTEGPREEKVIEAYCQLKCQRRFHSSQLSCCNFTTPPTPGSTRPTRGSTRPTRGSTRPTR